MFNKIHSKSRNPKSSNCQPTMVKFQQWLGFKPRIVPNLPKTKVGSDYVRNPEIQLHFPVQYFRIFFQQFSMIKCLQIVSVLVECTDSLRFGNSFMNQSVQTVFFFLLFKQKKKKFNRGRKNHRFFFLEVILNKCRYDFACMLCFCVYIVIDA